MIDPLYSPTDMKGGGADLEEAHIVSEHLRGEAQDFSWWRWRHFAGSKSRGRFGGPSPWGRPEHQPRCLHPMSSDLIPSHPGS